MADGLYVSMCGAAARQEQLDAIADNLANAQTPGFKASRPAFASFLPASGADDKVYPAAVASGFDLRNGPSVTTGNALDVLPEDGAFLAIHLPDGRTGYTRDGRLAVDGEHRLVSQGRPVLDRGGGEIHLPGEEKPEIGADGTVRVAGQAVAELGRFRLQGPVDRVGATALAPADGGLAEPVEAVLRTGEVEMGNTQPIEATVQLISAQRAFDSTMQALQTYRRMDDRSTEIGRVR
jgi:flagellar basal-body rod protein FlgF